MAIILDKEMAKRVLKVDIVSDRIISVKIQADPARRRRKVKIML